jgi:hypothetical protein
VQRPSSGKGLVASRTIVVATSMVVGATRAPAFGARVRVFAKRGQMTGGPEDSLDREASKFGTGVSGQIRFRRVRP